MRPPILHTFENYVYAQGRDLVEEPSPAFPLFTPERLDEMLSELRAMLRRDREQLPPEGFEGPVVDGIRRHLGQWFQRIDFPAQGISTTSDPSWSILDEGGVNRLGRHLTSEEACLLRPWPKWLYLRPLLPDLRGKSIMEIGSNNGFFPFRFAELGAARVTGVEVQRRKHDAAVWANSVLGWRNIEFRNADFLVDLSLEPHDVVFASEVVNHMLCPLWAIARLVTLARETLILDTGVFESSEHSLELSTGWTRDGGTLRFLSFHISDGLLCSYLKLLGIQANEIVKYEEKGAEHTLYLIDTRGVQERRARGEIVENLRHSLLMNLTLPNGSRVDSEAEVDEFAVP
jgi:SAM-dependent methyltransferase